MLLFCIVYHWGLGHWHVLSTCIKHTPWYLSNHWTYLTYEEPTKMSSLYMLEYYVMVWMVALLNLNVYIWEEAYKISRIRDYLFEWKWEMREERSIEIERGERKIDWVFVCAYARVFVPTCENMCVYVRTFEHVYVCNRDKRNIWYEYWVDMMFVSRIHLKM